MSSSCLFRPFITLLVWSLDKMLFCYLKKAARGRWDYVSNCLCLLTIPVLECNKQMPNWHKSETGWAVSYNMQYCLLYEQVSFFCAWSHHHHVSSQRNAELRPTPRPQNIFCSLTIFWFSHSSLFCGEKSDVRILPILDILPWVRNITNVDYSSQLAFDLAQLVYYKLKTLDISSVTQTFICRLPYFSSSVFFY